MGASTSNGFPVTVIRRFTASATRAEGVYLPSVLGRECGDGRWEAWLFFAPLGNGSAGYVTELETHQRDRATLQLWASGLTPIYIEGALARARRESETTSRELTAALEEIVESVDRGRSRLIRAGEHRLAAEATRLRTHVSERAASLRERANDEVVMGDRGSKKAKEKNHQQLVKKQKDKQQHKEKQAPAPVEHERVR
jgi:hypothetical protein